MMVIQLRDINNAIVHPETVPRHLHEAGLHSKWPISISALRHGNFHVRFAWAEGQLDWFNVLFTDESIFVFHPESCQVKVGR